MGPAASGVLPRTEISKFHIARCQFAELKIELTFKKGEMRCLVFLHALSDNVNEIISVVHHIDILVH